MNHQSASNTNPLNMVVIVAALGYFVDIYDLILFGIVKDPSLRALGVPESELFTVGSHLLNMQMIGMLTGGIIWGILGDKRGRLSTLFLTILLYSLANIANGFVQNVTQYEWMRFIAGVGLAGELGVGITLVSEIMTKESRGVGTSIVSGIGIAGAVLGFLIADWFDWRMAYFVGGGLGLLLLVLRISVYESGLFEKSKSNDIKRGDFLSLFNNLRQFKKYMLAILIGIPVWYSISQLAINASVYAKEGIVDGMISNAKAVTWHYVGASIGAILFGMISERYKSRRIGLFSSLFTLAVFIGLYFFLTGIDPVLFYAITCGLGLAMGGLWAIFMVNASEQFGTNLRATVTTTAPNFVRGTTVIISFGIVYLKQYYGIWFSGLVLGILCIVISLLAISFTEQSFGKDLDYVE
ncbi:MAG: MFS transporter [Saprospiraceae bacterium]|uniref:MFS transporter n=1 Tax=Candidatus Defluviibacterium haderslevense TaxID=2981993 RepID=A0A9D7XG53_9BACT|nr:MFS transporter [Candidatus Defluviibacterium haderslevense]